jgi:SMI1 / KNR4 family (SUKH-1)
MRLAQHHAPVEPAQLDAVERALQLRLPLPLRASYLQSNGGIPEPYVYEDERLDTVVTAFLPLVPRPDASRTAVDVYQHLVASLGLVPSSFLPFAVDGGGDYFFVDCATLDAAVYFYRGDASDEERVLPLSLGLAEFWDRLKPE